MRRALPPFLLLLLPAAVCFEAPNAAFAIHNLQATKNDVWVISQSNRFLGDLDLYVASDRIKVIHKRDQWQVVCAPPNWDVFVVNPRSKTMARSPLSEWRKFGIATMFALDPMPKEWPVKKEFDFKYKGVAATQYAFPYVYKNGTVVPLTRGRAGECITTQDIKTAPQVIDFITALYSSSPQVPGVPLEISKFGTPQSFGLGLKYNKIEELYTILRTDAIKTMPKSQVSYLVPKYAIRPRNEVVLGTKGKDVGGIVDLLGGD